MAKAGIQQMSLPDIYAMFKTASDEDKIKLMNTYANLGERLGEYDKDIDYRRKRGDKTALTEKMYTEGIGDVVGSAWDYTKQGAETAWDYAKKGAKKGAESLRDLVMRDTAVNDLVRGDEYIEEEQLPVNDTPLPWESEGNAFVGSKEDADIDPLAGGISRDPGMSLFELKNALEPESEEETLSPQEQRFLGVEPEKEEVVESPMARRMRERLEKLTAQQEQYADNPDARWSDMYNIDPERASFDWNRVAPKGSGASGTVQARLEHDRNINMQIAEKATQLISDMKVNGWTSDSPEYIKAYNDIITLNNSKYQPSNKNDVDKFIDREMAGQRVALGDRKVKLAEEKELDKQEMEAINLAYDTSKDTLSKAKDVAVQIGKVNGLLKEGMKGNAPSISAAAKILIQSFDNSAVLGNEIGMLTNQSWLGQLNSLVEKGLRGTTYTKQDVKNLFDIANSIATINNSYVNKVSGNASRIYKSLQGEDSKTIPLLFNGYLANVKNLPPEWETMPDSVVDSLGRGSAKGTGSGGGLVIPPPKGTGSGSYTYHLDDF